MGLFNSKKKFKFNVAGLSYRSDDIPNKWFHKPDADCDGLSAELIPEPDNKHDKNAIKVIVSGIHVGYVPRNLTANVKNIMDKFNVYEIDAYFIRDDDDESAEVVMFYKK